MPDTKKTSKGSNVWTDEERAAMQEAAKERKRSKSRGTSTREDGERDVLEKIAEMPESDRVIAERIHAIVTEVAPELEPRTWYGMPAWAKDGKVICFFTPGEKFKERYASFGFQTPANLDDGNMWPTSWAVERLTKSEEDRIAELVKRAVS